MVQFHIFHCFLTTEETSFEIDIHDQIECLLVTCFKRRYRGDSSIIEEAVYLAEFFVCLLKKIFAITNFQKVCINENTFAPVDLHQFYGIHAGSSVASADHDFCPLACKFLRCGTPNTLGATGNDNNFVLQSTRFHLTEILPSIKSGINVKSVQNHIVVLCVKYLNIPLVLFHAIGKLLFRFANEINPYHYLLFCSDPVMRDSIIYI